LERLKALVARDRLHSADLLAHLTEVQRRKLYHQAGHPSLYVYCVHELNMSEAVAYKRIRAARVVRSFPFVLDFIADGRLHLDAIKRLAPHLNVRNVRELIEAASNRTSREVELLLAERFPKPDQPTVLRPLLPPPTPCPSAEVGAGEETPSLESDITEPAQLAARPVVNSAPVDALRGVGPLSAPEPRPSPVAPLSPGRFLLQVTLDQHTHDLLQRAKELLAATQPGCDAAQVLERALRELIASLEQQKFGDTDAPRTRGANCDSRHIPAEIRRRVAERDGKRCTFLSEQGTRCPERAMLEYDHVRPVALGGRSTVENLRVRCRAHNQFEAEQLYGEAFMQQ
jgi:5-methylcytosine-specific restriction endonuclease McrA